MYKLMTLLICMALPAFVMTQETDYELIEQTLNYYLDGGTNNDIEMINKAFHETAMMKYIGDEYVEVNALEFFGRVVKPGPKQDRRTSIVSIEITGTAASARLRIDYPTFCFHDYMHLLKVDGEWKIVSKLFYRENK